MKSRFELEMLGPFRMFCGALCEEIRVHAQRSIRKLFSTSKKLCLETAYLTSLERVRNDFSKWTGVRDGMDWNHGCVRTGNPSSQRVECDTFEGGKQAEF